MVRILYIIWRWPGENFCIILTSVVIKSEYRVICRINTKSTPGQRRTTYKIYQKTLLLYEYSKKK